ncbi:hypothetical protein NDR87_00030 [Nocardia sp. CDC159]|uniref:DUF2690 domain-containing protein n=1 Tax=Nocardia pulmonis TaxID=2951408 RepID=A0A9X2E6V7_9NOCA|nr:MULTISPECIES: hypothetical protein [Nocardia]MCM6772603.1 hypothetical protein [Nocardia pulmonis]MCM6784739.1 hypothetical protein [Nocardia sp. CDC159]
MTLKCVPPQRFSARAGAVVATIAAALVGFAGPAAAGPTDPVVQFTPTFTRVPGNCAAIINAETVPQPRSGELGVRVRITQFGQGCRAYELGVLWRNLDTGYSSGQVQGVHGTVVSGAPDGVITGIGMAPRAGRVEARIVTYSKYYPQPQELEHVSGRATFTLS